MLPTTGQQHLDQSAVMAVISALIQDELKQLRNSPQGLFASPKAQLVPDSQASNLQLDDDAIVVDSFEWMALATRVINFFALSSSGLEDYLLRKHYLVDWAEVVLKSRELASTNITFQTSGSTGAAKSVTHCYRELIGEMKFFRNYFNQHDIPVTRVVSLVPAHHMYGFLFSVVLPMLSDVPVIRGMSARAAVQGGTLQAGDLVIGYPAVLQQLAQRGVTFAQGVHVITSTGPCPSQVIEQLQAGGVSKVIEVYGSTDTSGIGVRQSPRQPYELLPRWQRLAADTLYDMHADAKMALPDALVWHGDRLFEPCGRRDHAVSVQGINVFPNHIAEILKQHPTVNDARVRLLTDEDSRGLKALLVVEQALSARQQNELIQSVKAYAASQLRAIELPKQWRVVDTVPVNQMGKETDWDLPKVVS